VPQCPRWKLSRGAQNFPSPYAGGIFADT